MLNTKMRAARDEIRGEPKTARGILHKQKGHHLLRTYYVSGSLFRFWPMIHPLLTKHHEKSEQQIWNKGVTNQIFTCYTKPGGLSKMWAWSYYVLVWNTTLKIKTQTSCNLVEMHDLVTPTPKTTSFMIAESTPKFIKRLEGISYSKWSIKL